MGKVIKKKIQGMSWQMKTSLVLLLTLATTVFMYEGWYKPKQAAAAVTTLTGWTNVYHNAALPGATAASFAVGAGTNRMLVVALSYESGSSAALTLGTGVTYGGVAMTAATGNDAATSLSMHSLIYYLKDNAVMDGTAKTLAVNITGGGTAVMQNIWYAVYTGVDQAATPTSQNYNNGATAGTTAAWATALTVNAGDQAVYVGTAARAAGAVTWPAPANGFWAAGGNTQSAGTTTGVALVRQRDVPVTNTTDTASSTGITSSRVSMTGLGLAAAAGNTLTVANTTVQATAPTQGDTNIVMQRLTLTANAGTIALNNLTLDDIGTSTSIAQARVYIDTAATFSLGTATLVASTSAPWTPGATVLSLSGQSVTAGTPEYIYIVYDVGTLSTIQSSVTAFTVGGTDSVSGTFPMNSAGPFTLVAAPSDILTVGTNTPIATTSSDTATGVVMQRVKLDSNAAGNGNVELNSITLDDNSATATSYANARIYIDTTATSTLPGTAVQIGSQAAFTGGSTVVSLAGGTAADRTVTSGTSKYLYIVYDMQSGQAPLTAASRITAVGVVAPDSGATGLTLASNTFALTVAPSNTITRCDGCHGYSASIGAGATYNDGTGRNVPTGQFQGSHNAHVIGETIVCSTCHVAPATETSADFGHSRGTITMQASINGGTYSRGSAGFAVSNTFTPGTCGGTSCHAQVYSATAGTSPNWGTAGGGCAACHNTTPGTFTGTGGGPVTGGHNMHMAVSGVVCGDCHNGAVSGVTGGALHGNGFINVTTGYLSTNPSRNKVAKRAAGGTYYACNNASCHSNPYAQGAATTAVWGTGTGGCVACHNGAGAFISYSASVNGNAGNPLQSGPNTASHSGHMNFGRYICGDCHAGALTGSSGGNKHGNGFINVTGANGAYVAGGIAKHAIGTYSATGCAAACHKGVGGTANPIWGSLVLGCVDCHKAVITRTKGRPGKTLANAVAEFGLAWGHKASGKTPARATVSDADCIVCHLEGKFSTQKTSNYHADGNIDLRDPDGAGETPITNISNAAFTFQRYSISFAATTRYSDKTRNDIPNVITRKFCMKCHDGNGATNPTARSNNGGTGTQFMPFGGIALGANYIANNGAIGTQGLINVFSQFSSGNSSRHPVGAPNTRAYPYSTRLAVPYNSLGTGRNTNTQLGNTATPRTMVTSVVLYCDDCHTTSAANTTLRTITAHGNAGSLRGTYYVTGPTLCLSCHVAGTSGAYNNTATTLPGGTHGAGSAFSGGTGATTRPAAAMNNCNVCHFSDNSATGPVRPRQAQDIHGFNNMYGTTAGWTYGVANGMRPIAFLRNATSWSTTTSPRPYSATVAGPGNFNLAAGQSTCGGNFAFGGAWAATCSNQSHTNYVPGGSY